MRMLTGPPAYLCIALVLSLGGCDPSEPTNVVESPQPTDPNASPPPDTSAPGPGPGSLPPDSTQSPPGSLPPPDPTTPPGPVNPPSHVGIPFGPYHQPPEHFSDFSGTVYTAKSASKLLADLQAAQRAGHRMFISFTGNERYNRDNNGFSVTKWKQQVDRFRELDLNPFINDGTIIGHFILDEPSDPSNWNGFQVPHAEIEEIARYSKERWPNMITMIRARTSYLAGHEYPHLDAVRVQYHSRFSDIDGYINTNVQAAKDLGLALVGGLNVLDGGSSSSGIPGKNEGKFGMSADEIRKWGGRYLQEQSLCAFFLWEYDSTYFSRPAIQAAVAELSRMAQDRPNQACQRAG